MNDEKIKQKKGKVRLDLIPMGVLKGVAEVMEFGLTKYEEDSWKQVPPEDYLAAAERHMLLGMHTDGLGSRADDSKLRHVYHAICDLMFIAHLIEDSCGEIQAIESVEKHIEDNFETIMSEAYDEEFISPKPDCIHKWIEGTKDIRPHCSKCGKMKTR